MMAGLTDSTNNSDASKAGAASKARGMAEAILAELHRAGERAKADKLTEILLAMTAPEAGAE